MNIMLSFDTRIINDCQTCQKAHRQISPIEDAACLVKLVREVGSRDKELTADQFLGAKRTDRRVQAFSYTFST